MKDAFKGLLIALGVFIVAWNLNLLPEKAYVKWGPLFSAECWFSNSWNRPEWCDAGYTGYY
jgi:hypothetical protein